MKQLTALLFIFLSISSAFAGDIALNFKDVPVNKLTEAVIKGFLNQDYVISPEAAAADSKVSLSVTGLDRDGVKFQLDQVLSSVGLSLGERRGVLYVEKPKRESVSPESSAKSDLSPIATAPRSQFDYSRPDFAETEVFVYFPRYRSVPYLADLINNIVSRFDRIQSVQPVAAAPSGSGLPVDKLDKEALVIKATPKEIQQVKKMLAQVDRPVPEMLVKAVLMEVQTGDTEGSAINLLAALISKGIGGVNLAWQGGADVKNGITFKVGGIEAVWSAISTDTRFKVVSSPQLRVKSGGSAIMSVGADTPILGAINYQGNGQSQQSIEYKPSGVILELRPEIRGAIAELKVRQQLSSFKKTETGVNNSPTLLKRELSTSVMVSQNDVVLLGGLEETKATSTKSGFFFMPEFMRSVFGDNSKSEIVLMLYVERVQSAPDDSI